MKHPNVDIANCIANPFDCRPARETYGVISTAL